MGIAPLGTELPDPAAALEGAIILGDDGRDASIVLGDPGPDVQRPVIPALVRRTAEPAEPLALSLTSGPVGGVVAGPVAGAAPGPIRPSGAAVASAASVTSVVGATSVASAVGAISVASATGAGPSVVAAPGPAKEAAPPSPVGRTVTVAEQPPSHLESGRAHPQGAPVPRPERDPGPGPQRGPGAVSVSAQESAQASAGAAARSSLRTPPRAGARMAVARPPVVGRPAVGADRSRLGDAIRDAAPPAPPRRPGAPVATGSPIAPIDSIESVESRAAGAGAGPGAARVDRPADAQADVPAGAPADAQADVPAGAPADAQVDGDDAPPVWPWPLRMVNPVRSHGWGARGGLAGVQRRPAGRRLEAELWVGAHPVASSALVDLDGREIPLLDAVELDPEGLLGRAHRDRFGARLPFLLKVMAVDRALAVQVHPARRQAAEGYARQEAAGVPLRGPARTFIDPHAKPELVVALTPFDALVGLRDPRHAARLLELLDVAPLVPLRRALTAAAGQAHGPARAGTVEAVVRLASWPFRQRAVLAAGVSDAARAALVNPVTAHHPDTRAALEWVIRLAGQHPGDPMVLAPLLLEFVHLEPGETVFVPPGVLHTFLHGVALEAAAASANVVRAGLTRRAVDPAAVEAAVEVAARPIVGVGEEAADRHETALLAPVEEFRLSRITLSGTGVVAPAPRPAGPQIMLCLDGEIEVGVGARLTHLCSGESAYLGPDATDVVLSGEGTVYRITAGG